jgi:hypothetical protein
MSLTGDFGNFIADFDYNENSTTSNIYTELYQFAFDEDDYTLDGTCMVLTANLYVEEPVGSGTTIQLVISGDSSTSIKAITIDTGTSLGLAQGSKYPITLLAKYFIQNVATIPTVVGVSYMVYANGGMVYYDYAILSVPIATTGNTLTLYAKTNGVSSVSTETVNIVLETKL